MLSPSKFRDLVSGRTAGVKGAALRGILRAVETPYACVVRQRNLRFDRGASSVIHAGVPTISVGNLTLGGTGKTPMVKWIAGRLLSQGRRVALVSRGYGARSGADQNDEARELALALPGVPHIQNRDRVAAARRAVAEFRVDTILLDDGFQHRRLARDLDIVLLDALEPFGFDHVFPRGTLREPAAGLARADVICLSRANTLEREERERLRRRAAALAPHALWCEAAHAPIGLFSADGKKMPIETLRNRRVCAFCGIGNTGGFRHTLAEAGCEVSAFREFPDHHRYSEADLGELTRLAESSHAESVICTRKDLVKIERAEIGNRPLWAIAIDMRFLIGEQEFLTALAGATHGVSASIA